MVFSRPLSDNSVAVVLFNSGSFGGPSNMTVDFSIVSWPSIKNSTFIATPTLHVYRKDGGIAHYTCLKLYCYLLELHVNWTLLLYDSVYSSFIHQVGLSGRIASVRDLFEHKDIGIYTDTYSTMVNPSGVKFLKLTPDKGKAAKDWLWIRVDFWYQNSNHIIS